MARLVFMSHDTWETALLEMDIFLSGKLLFDNGVIQEPSAQKWMDTCGYDRDEIFIKALTLITNSFVCVHPQNEEGEQDDRSAYEEGVIYSISLPQVQQWHKQSRRYAVNIIRKKEDALLSPLNRVDIGAGFTDGEFTAELTPYGLKISVYGGYRFYHLAIKEFFTFMKCLEKELAEGREEVK